MCRVHCAPLRVLCVRPLVRTRGWHGQCLAPGLACAAGCGCAFPGWDASHPQSVDFPCVPRLRVPVLFSGRKEGRTDRRTDGGTVESARCGPASEVQAGSGFQKLDRPGPRRRASRARGSHGWVGWWECWSKNRRGDEGRGGAGEMSVRPRLALTVWAPCSIRVQEVVGRQRGVGGACGRGSGRAEGRVVVQACVRVRFLVCGAVRCGAVVCVCVQGSGLVWARSRAGGGGGGVAAGGGRRAAGGERWLAAAGSWGLSERPPSSTAIPP